MRTPFLSAAALVTMCIVPALRAQVPANAPVITPTGDPSVKSDTIYKLAVKPEDYPDESMVYLLDDGVVRLNADGRGTRTFRQVVQVLREDGVEDMNEHSFSYTPGHQRLTLNWIRVLKPDGTVISEAPSHVQDADIPARRGDPVYSDTKVKRVSLTGVEPGTIVDYSYTIEELKPYLPGDFLETWGISTGIPVMRSRYLLDLPADMRPNFRERNLPTPRQTATAKGRTVYLWSAKNIPTIKQERFASFDSNTVIASVAVSAPTTWGKVATWYAGNAKDRYALSPALTAKVRELVHDAKTRDDSIRAIHRWVSQDIRYVALALDMGGYQPRMPDSVMTTGFGDCKDKTTLFVSALHAMDVTAYPVLLNSSSKVRKEMPSFQQFDHVIAAVKGAKGFTYTDLTATTLPYGTIPFGYQGYFGLVVYPDGKSEEITFPRYTIIENTDSTRINGALDTTGYFSGRYTESATGAMAEAMRSVFETPMDSTQRANFVKAIARRYFENAMGDSLVAFNGKDLQAKPVYSVLIQRGKAATVSGSSMVVMLPFSSAGGANTMADELATAPKRQFPIDARQVLGTVSTFSELRMTLPPGWRAKLPPSVRAEGVFGTYSSEYVQEGNVLRVTRQTRGAEGIYAPEKVTDLIEWFRQVGKDDVKFVIVERAGE